MEPLSWLLWTALAIYLPVALYGTYLHYASWIESFTDFVQNEIFKKEEPGSSPPPKEEKEKITLRIWALRVVLIPVLIVLLVVAGIYMPFHYGMLHIRHHYERWKRGERGYIITLALAIDRKGRITRERDFKMFTWQPVATRRHFFNEEGNRVKTITYKIDNRNPVSITRRLFNQQGQNCYETYERLGPHPSLSESYYFYDHLGREIVHACGAGPDSRSTRYRFSYTPEGYQQLMCIAHLVVETNLYDCYRREIAAK